MKKTYTIIDINGKKHIICGIDVTHVFAENTNEIAIKFWDYVNGERNCVAFFNFRNIISVSETYVNDNDVEIEEMSDSMVEPTCKINISPVGHSCLTCKHKDKTITAEPCMDCLYCNRWEAKNDQTTL